MIIHIHTDGIINIPNYISNHDEFEYPFNFSIRCLSGIISDGILQKKQKNIESDNIETVTNETADLSEYIISWNETDCKGDVILYRGMDFVKKFENMLNHTGGVYAYIIPKNVEDRSPTPKKKPQVRPSSTPGVKPQTVKDETDLSIKCKDFTGKTWIDMKRFIKNDQDMIYGEYIIEDCFYKENNIYNDMTILKLSITINRPIIIEDKDIKIIYPKKREITDKINRQFPTVDETNYDFQKCITDCVDLIGGELQRIKRLNENQSDIFEEFKKSNNYQSMKRQLHRVMIGIIKREIKENSELICEEKKCTDEFYCHIYSKLTCQVDEYINILIKNRKKNNMNILYEDPKILDNEVDDTLDNRFTTLAFESEIIQDWNRADELHLKRLEIEKNADLEYVWLDYISFCLRKGDDNKAQLLLKNYIKDNYNESIIILCSLLLQNEDINRYYLDILMKSSISYETITYILLSYYNCICNNLKSAEMYHILSRKPKKYFDSFNEPIDDLVNVEMDIFYQEFTKYTQTENYIEYPIFDNVYEDSDEDTKILDAIKYLLDIGCYKFGMTILRSGYKYNKTSTDRLLPKLCNRFSCPLHFLSSKCEKMSQRYKLLEIEFCILAQEWEIVNLLVEDLFKFLGHDRVQKAWLFTGEASYHLCEFSFAKKAFETAMEFKNSPINDPVVHIRRGHTFLELGEYQEAYNAFMKSLSIR
eukprot:GHVL01021106.1.p1 GENE.GHVL01021106.1~~GHVL01021106.1.p1  ORF type:complete len:705 (+),score=203.54 GHVL01021106.1:336-2450(+)